MIYKKSIVFFAAIAMIFSFASCEDNSLSTTNPLHGYIGMEGDKNVGLVVGQTLVVDAKVVASEAVSVDRTFPLVVDPTSTHSSSYYSVPATVKIPAGSTVGVFQVSITGTNVGSDGKTLIVGIPQEMGVDQTTSYSTTNGVVNRKIKFNIYEVCATGLQAVKLQITFDNYPEETAWELYDSNSNVIASGGLDPTGTTITGYAALGFADRSTFKTGFCLAPGNYRFVIYDDYGDGMYTSATVSGTYSLKLLDGTVLASGGGDFGLSAETPFTIN